MAKMVTRSIKVTECVCAAYDLEKEVLTDVTIKVAGNYKKEENLMKALNEAEPGVRILKIKSKNETIKTYGVPEQFFMDHARELTKNDTDVESEE